MLNRLIPIQQIEEDFLKENEVELYILRLDLIHQYVSGNKWFKLNYNIEQAKKEHKNSILTFGGAFSNHIVATAVAGKLVGLHTIGVIRGEESSRNNHYLQIAQQNGMELFFVSREEYKLRNNENCVQQWQEKFPQAFIIPEGGANALGMLGCKDILNFTLAQKDNSLFANYNDVNTSNSVFNIISCACGTATTFAGIASSLQNNQQILGFQVLKGENYLATEIAEKYNIQLNQTIQMNENYHFKGYAKRTTELDLFIDSFIEKHQIPIEFVYTGKMLFGIYDLCKKGYFAKGSKILAVHSGGVNQSPY